MTTPMVTTSSASGTWTDVTVSTYESVRIYYHAKLIENAQPQILHGRFAGEKVNVPLGYGGNITFHNFGNIDTTVASYALIDNGDPGTAVTLAISEKTTTLPQFGMWAYGTQRVEALSIDDVVAGYTKRMGEAAGIIVDKITRAILLAATTNVVTTDNGSPLTITLLRKAVHKLKGNNSKPFKFGGKSRFVGIVGTDAMYDLWSDSTLQSAMQYGYGNQLADNEANLLDGMIMPELDVVGVRLFESTLADATGGGGTACNTSATIVLAQDAYSVVEQDENSMKHYFIPSGTPDKSDVLQLRWYMGWKCVHNAMVTNPEHMCIIRHAAIGG